MALMGYCIHLCDTVIIGILLLIRIYLDVLDMVDSKDSGSLFDDTKHIPSKAHRIQESGAAQGKPSYILSVLSLTLLSAPKKGSSSGWEGQAALQVMAHLCLTAAFDCSSSSAAPQASPKDALGTLKCQDALFRQKVA